MRPQLNGGTLGGRQTSAFRSQSQYSLLALGTKCNRLAAAMIFLAAITALFVFTAANGIAIATLLSSSWKTTIALVERRRRLCRIALYSVPAAAFAKWVILSGFIARPGSSFGAALVSTLFAGFLPFLAYQKVTRLLEGFEMRDLISGRD
jgi:hypothetical protein